ncbi:MAG: FtsQ-type POTRA domain-containing protein [Patescibacteria group bacterium]|nr:FtsQ-type POTRA domain-containing protein [Patescibacteria group bacterium]
MDKMRSYRSFQKYRTEKKRGWLSSLLFGKKNNVNVHRSVSTVSLNMPHHNPRSYLQEKTNKRDLRRAFLIYGTIGIFVLWLLLMLYLPYFRITKTNYEGLKIIKKEEIDGFIREKYLKRGLLYPYNNFFLVSKNNIAEDLEKKYALASLTVEKVFPDGLKITLKEKTTTVIYDNGSSAYLLDKEGTVIKMLWGTAGTSTAEMSSSSPAAMILTADIAPEEMATSSATSTVASKKYAPDFKKLVRENDDLPIIYDARNIPIYEKETGVLPPEIITAAIEWHEVLGQQGIGEVEYFTVDNPSAGLEVYLDKPWFIKVQPKNNFDAQLNNLKTLLASPEVKPGEYIDLRQEKMTVWK